MDRGLVCACTAAECKLPEDHYTYIIYIGIRIAISSHIYARGAAERSISFARVCSCAACRSRKASVNIRNKSPQEHASRVRGASNIILLSLLLLLLLFCVAMRASRREVSNLCTIIKCAHTITNCSKKMIVRIMKPVSRTRRVYFNDNNNNNIDTRKINLRDRNLKKKKN